MTEYFLSVGSNIHPKKNIPACLDLLRQEFSLTRVSSVYKTVPVGIENSPHFWNLALALKSSLSREKLNEKLRQIESRLGRIRDPKNKFAPRTIDLDILPQSGYLKHAFIMIPLAEIAPEGRDEETGENYKKAAALLRSHAGYQRLKIKF